MTLQDRIWNRAERYIGIHEIHGEADHPLILWWHKLCHIEDADGVGTDEIPWCSSFVNGVCWDEYAPMTYSARARSWLEIAAPVSVAEAVRGDIVVIKRGKPPQPGPEVIKAKGHVYVFGTAIGERIEGIGGNQGNQVSLASFPIADLLSIRRL